MRKAYTVFGAICFFLLFAIASAQADDTPDLYRPTPVAEIFEKAVKFGGFEQACGRRPAGCAVPQVRIAETAAGTYGTFTWNEPTVVNISSSVVPGSLQFNSTLLHEFVHYLQWLTGKIGPHNWCAVAVEAEQQAYEAAAKYHAEFGLVRDYEMQMTMVRMNVMFAIMAGGC